jgi:hypothetical protein
MLRADSAPVPQSAPGARTPHRLQQSKSDETNAMLLK